MGFVNRAPALPTPPPAQAIPKHPAMSATVSGEKGPEPKGEDRATVRFSVLVPTYNRKELLRQTVDSVLSQTFPSHEVIVIDDGSTDGTLADLESYGDKIRVISQTNQGPEAARRQAARIAKGEYLVLLDSDDILMPWALETYDRLIQEFNQPGVVIGTLESFDGVEAPPPARTPTEIVAWRFEDYLSKEARAWLSSSNIVVRKTIFDQVGFTRPELKTFPVDTYHYVLMFGTSSPCALVKKPVTVAYRHHDGNAIRNVERMVKALDHLVEAERLGVYPGGRESRFSRYACIGSAAISWIRIALSHRLYSLALSGLAHTWPMVLAALARHVRKLFSARSQTVRLSLAKPNH